MSPKERDNYVADLELAALHKTSNINVYQKLANRYLFVNEHDKAIKLCETTLKNDSLKLLHFTDEEKKMILDELENQKKEKIQYIKGIEQQKLQRENQIKTLTAKFKKEGLNSKDLAERGYAYHFLNKENAALTDFNKAIELDSNNRMALTQRANVLVNLGKYNKAVVEYEALIKKYPNSNSIYIEKLAEVKDKLNE